MNSSIVSEREQFSLIARVRRGELNFDRLCELLSTRGYVTDLEHEPGLSFNRPCVNHTRRDDFNALLQVLYPGRSHDIELSTIATDEGGQRGAFTYAVFNEALIARDEMHALLVEFNANDYTML